MESFGQRIQQQKVRLFETPGQTLVTQEDKAASNVLNIQDQGHQPTFQSVQHEERVRKMTALMKSMKPKKGLTEYANDKVMQTNVEAGIYTSDKTPADL